MIAVQTLWCIIACASGGCAGLCGMLRLQSWWRQRMKRKRHFEAVMIPSEAKALNLSSDGLAESIVGYCVMTGNRIASGALEPLCRRSTLLLERCGSWFSAHSRTVGLGGLVTKEGFCEARIRLAVAGATFATICGAVFSNELAGIGFASGIVLGFMAPRWALQQEEKARCDELERELPQMLEVVALGLRSGLSFDKSLQLYHGHFGTPFSRACASAQRQWDLGLQTREEALRALAGSYASPGFTRIAESMIRSLRFGTSLSGQLESAAKRSRALHSAKREEMIAKAPVKMMIPTGTLILPAMLILVLGPVLLELMEGF